MNDRLTVLCGDALKKLRELPDGSVQCGVSSPPYFGLRDYGIAGQIGLEKTPIEYVRRLVKVMREARRVLRKDGVFWLNLGDSYAGSWGAQSHRVTPASLSHTQIKNHPKRARTGSIRQKGLKAKDLIGIPWMVAFALRADGWWLRQDVIWSKPNPMPESVTDRCTKAHEYIFLLSKSKHYFFDTEAIKEEAEYREDARPFGDAGGNRHSDEKTVYDPIPQGGGLGFNLADGADVPGRTSKKRGEFNGKTNAMEGREAFRAFTMVRNKRSVWNVASQPYAEAHFATYPPELIKPCVLAGSRPGDTILDPFAGSGTTGMVAIELGRKAVLIELNPKYIDLIKNRCDITPGLALA